MGKRNISIIDSKDSGHHKPYASLAVKSAKNNTAQNQVSFIGYTLEEVETEEVNFPNYKNILIRFIMRLYWAIKVLNFAIKEEKAEQVHFIHLDCILLIAPVLYFILFFLKKSVSLPLLYTIFQIKN